ncbi:MAG: hypothetical protein WBE26_11080 [Phycisphaerae bacterium]
MTNRGGKIKDEGSRMNVRFLLSTGLIALSVVAWAPFAWGQTGANPEVKQVDWPDTHAGRYGKAFFEAYNADGKDALRRFIKEHYSEELSLPEMSSEPFSACRFAERHESQP